MNCHWGAPWNNLLLGHFLFQVHVAPVVGEIE